MFPFLVKSPCPERGLFDTIFESFDRKRAVEFSLFYCRSKSRGFYHFLLFLFILKFFIMFMTEHILQSFENGWSKGTVKGIERT
jgi:hypothetical protein